MKALTVRQPWAAAMFREIGPKSIENRTWATSLRERIAIHAGKNLDRPAMLALGIDRIPERDRGVVLGTVEITGCHEAGSKQCDWHGCRDNFWAQWPTAAAPVMFHWELEHPREFVTPIRATGALQFWEPGPSVAHLIEIAEIRL